MGGSYSMVEKGYIYILTNPSFPDYVKIGYADGLFCLHWQKRLFKVKLICNSMKLITFYES